MNGLAPHTQKIFEAVASLDCIKPYLLVGGTALSLQINTRQSEDLDFMKWRTSKSETPEVDWFHIEKELETVGKVESRNLMDIDHVEFVLEGVKLSFYSSPKYSLKFSSISLILLLIPFTFSIMKNLGRILLRKYK